MEKLEELSEYIRKEAIPQTVKKLLVKIWNEKRQAKRKITRIIIRVSEYETYIDYSIAVYFNNPTTTGNYMFSYDKTTKQLMNITHNKLLTEKKILNNFREMMNKTPPEWG